MITKQEAKHRLQVLDDRLGVGVGAAKERARYAEILDGPSQKATTKKTRRGRRSK